MRNRNSLRSAGLAALAAALLGGCDFAETSGVNPNVVNDAAATQLFTAIQVNTFFSSETQTQRLATMWMQQLAGTDRQFSILDIYVFSEGDGSDLFYQTYTGGGLIAIRDAKEEVAAIECRVCLGILKVYEAYLVGTTADVWGDIPYTEAARPDIDQPQLDEQLEVYAMLQTLLDEAIADLRSGEVGGGGQFLAADYNFGGDAGAWEDVAHTLKARFFMHTAEVEPGAYAQARAAAAEGIMDPANNWRAIHTNVETESNAWFQFTRDRSGYISAGHFLVDLMNGGTPFDFSDDDPRLAFYFTPTSNIDTDNRPAFIGSRPGTPEGDPGQGAAQLNRQGAAAASYDQPLVTCAENQFILAEAAYQMGDEAAANEALDAGIRCQERYFTAVLGTPIELEEPGTLAGRELLVRIMNAKYIALFLNQEVWADYQRTCLPEIDPYRDQRVPARLLYPAQERQVNTHVPPPDAQPPRNDNDPNPCPVT